MTPKSKDEKLTSLLAPLIQGNRGNSVVKMPAKVIVSPGDSTPVAIADSGASHVILRSFALQPGDSHRTVNLHRREIYADHVRVPLCPLTRIIRKLQSSESRKALTQIVPKANSVPNQTR